MSDVDEALREGIFDGKGVVVLCFEDNDDAVEVVLLLAFAPSVVAFDVVCGDVVVLAMPLLLAMGMVVVEVVTAVPGKEAFVIKSL